MELPDSVYLDNAISYIERLMKEKKRITPKMIDSEVESVILDAQNQYGVQSNPPMYAHHMRERKTHGLSLKQMRRLYAMVSRGSQKAITFARNVLGIPFDETASQVKAVVKHHILDLAEKKVRRNPGAKFVFVTIHNNYFHWRTDDNRSGGQPFSSNSELKNLLLKLKSLLGLRKDQIEIRDERGIK